MIDEAAASPLITWTLPPGVPEPQTITVTEEMVARGGGGAGGLAPWSSEQPNTDAATEIVWVQYLRPHANAAGVFVPAWEPVRVPKESGK